MLSASETIALLDDLCRGLGFCLSPDAQRKLSSQPPQDVDSFTNAVFSEEGLDPATADRRLYRQVREVISTAFARPK